MSDHVDSFCPQCHASIGIGTLETVGCPLCGYSDEIDDDSDDEDDDTDNKNTITLTWPSKGPL